jgi:D-sedoheptulose 7-phosphate isomerase
VTALAIERIDELLADRLDASARFFGAEAGRIAELCRVLAGCFERGGRLLAVGGTPQEWSDAHHLAVEFVHPVIVGKRALPALALDEHDLQLLAQPDDVLVTFEPLTIAGETFEPPSTDPFVRQELAETLYHLVWELVHVFFEHGGSSGAGGGAAEFLYPFLAEAATAGDDVVADVRASVLLKADETSALRAQTLTEGLDALLDAAALLRRSFDAGGAALVFGNGGSATDAADLVADLRAATPSRKPRPALDLSGDSAILTALANDVGTEVLFQRQVIAYGRPGDVAIALSTSGGSPNVLAALAEARRRELGTVAFVGYGGGRVEAEQLADHVVVTRSEHIPRIQEAQASAYHVLRELVA